MALLLRRLALVLVLVTLPPAAKKHPARGLAPTSVSKKVK
jgi:hypothetical protein